MIQNNDLEIEIRIPKMGSDGDTIKVQYRPNPAGCLEVSLLSATRILFHCREEQFRTMCELFLRCVNKEAP